MDKIKSMIIIIMPPIKDTDPIIETVIGTHSGILPIK
jgi:hypothetical protein